MLLRGNYDGDGLWQRDGEELAAFSCGGELSSCVGL